jgi:hypothetical protein
LHFYSLLNMVHSGFNVLPGLKQPIFNPVKIPLSGICISLCFTPTFA